MAKKITNQHALNTQRQLLDRGVSPQTADNAALWVQQMLNKKKSN